MKIKLTLQRFEAHKTDKLSQEQEEWRVLIRRGYVRESAERFFSRLEKQFAFLLLTNER